MLRFVFIFCFIVMFSILGLAQNTEHKSVEQLVDLLKGDNRELSDLAIEELVEKGKESVSLILPIVEDKNEDQFVRVRAIIVLGRIKDKDAVPILINVLNDKNSYVKGRSAYALSQIGGEDAKDAIFEFLKTSLVSDSESLPKAVEATRELPNPRTFPYLIKILEIAQKQNNSPESRNKEKDVVKDSTLRYAIQALGNIGDARASVLIAQFLTPTAYYVGSEDYLYLQAIYKSKGKNVIPYLVSYLEEIVKRLSGKEKPWDELGAGNKQIIYNFGLYKQTLDCLEAITGQKSVGATREDVAMFWKLHQEVHN